MGKTPAQKVYSVKWRQIERRRKRCNAFITEYTRLKFGNVYNEAICFYNSLDAIHPHKLDLRRTKEFKRWKEALINAENPESSLIVQTLHTSVSYGGKRGKQNNTETTNNESYNNYEETAESGNNSEKAAESDTESDNNSESDTVEEEEEGFETTNNSENQSDYCDNMLLQIPLEKYLPPVHQDKNTQTTVSETEPDYDYEVFSDERFQQIVDELRNDPELRNIFAEPENLLDQEEDEGVELRTLEEELEVDIEPFDYRLEVELSNWESQL